MPSRFHITDYYYRNDGSRIILPLKFIPQGGYYPLLSILPIYKGYDNPYFTGSGRRATTSRLHDKLSIINSGYPIKYRKNGHSYDSAMNLYTGFLSAMGTSKDFEYMPSTLTGDVLEYRMKGNVDIFCLGVIDVKHLPEVKHDSQARGRYIRRSNVIEINFDPTKAKILLNIDKLRKAQFCKEVYSVTVRSRLLEEIKKVRRSGEIVVEEVSNEEIERFAVSPNAVRTNSIVEILQLKDRLRDSVFSNLNTAKAV